MCMFYFAKIPLDSSCVLLDITATTKYVIFRFRMHPRGAIWLLKWGSACIHVGVRLVLQWPWEAYHQNHNCLGFLANI
jgi:hypothetical protein